MKKKRRATKSTEERVEDLNNSGSGKKLSLNTAATGSIPVPKRRRLTPLSPLKVNATGNKTDSQVSVNLLIHKTCMAQLYCIFPFITCHILIAVQRVNHYFYFFRGHP